MTYHPSYLSPQARERTIQNTQTSGTRTVSQDITPGDLRFLEIFVGTRLDMARFRRAPMRYIREQEKQLLIVKNLKVGTTA